MELEHRSPKSRYLRTSRKDFEKQLGHIERRQARIRRIRQKLNNSGNDVQKTFIHEKSPGAEATVAATYHIGKTQNHPLDIGILARKNYLDPAAKVEYSTVIVGQNTLLNVYIPGFHTGIERASPVQGLGQAAYRFKYSQIWCRWNPGKHCRQLHFVERQPHL